MERKKPDFSEGVDQKEESKRTEKEEESFAMLLLKDYKKGAKRWFIAFILVVLLWAATIGSIIAGAVYAVRVVTDFLSEYEFSYYEATQDSKGANYSVANSEGVTFGTESTGN